MDYKSISRWCGLQIRTSMAAVVEMVLGTSEVIFPDFFKYPFYIARK